ncbi:MAG: PQQ-dependent sugar dehydrogenase [Anaerolineae bacterium]|nr:PQQ-dependent sugar dehydrogenase [Anaerolineae bacterium]
MRRITAISLLLSLCFLLLSSSVGAQSAVPTAPNPALYRLVEVTRGLSQPLLVTHAGDARLFILEKVGRIRIFQNGALLPTPFLDIGSLISLGNEQGLLGLAFHPQYATNGWFFINYTRGDGDTVIARYTRSANNPNVADPNSGQQVMLIDQPYSNHNGGHMAFGRDGFLYIGMGDGGSGGDPQNRAQNPNELLGKMLRINVNQLPYTIPANNPFVGRSGYRAEIWSLGLRNPWRWSFDRQNGDIYIGDVGQGNWEEISLSPGTSPGGENYEWNFYEGTNRYRTGEPTIGTRVGPFTQYDHSQGCSVTGGYVYRGSRLPALQGVYFFADYCNGNIRTAFRDASNRWVIAPFLNSGVALSSFGEDAAGELYINDLSGGRIFRLDSVATPTPLPATATRTPFPPTPTITRTATRTNTPLPTVTATRTSSATPLPTATVIPPSSTPLPSATLVPPTNTALPTNTLVPPSSTPLPSATVVPPTLTPLPSATVPPPTATLPASQPTLRIDLNPAAGGLGTPVLASLNLLNVSDVYGLQVVCSVNPAVLAGISRTDGDGFSAGSSYIVDQGFKPDGSWVIAASRLQPAAPINGNAIAFTLNYLVIGPNDSAVTCQALAVDRNGVERSLTVINASFDGVDGPAGTATPTSLPPTPTIVVPTATPTPLPTLTLTPIPGSISGRAVYQNRPDNAGITAAVLDLNGNVLVQVVTGADGVFGFTDAPVGNYRLRLSAAGHLSQTQDVAVTTPGQTIDLGTLTLRAGDTNGDNTIDLVDAAFVGANFNVTAPPAPAEADLNKDGVVNISDLVLVGSNFGVTGS